ncbi:hypothetical protein LIA77_06184 [Sarocladium implicatum]|nr:hypothetical protein LIA77_06184 [Sarocladium implicatum]
MAQAQEARDSASTNPGLSQAGPTEQDVQDMPWKYIGYRGYSEFLSSDDENFILRRFATLNVRVALALQDKVSRLEGELSGFDALHSIPDPVEYNNGTLRGDLPTRTLILDRLTSALERYSKTYADTFILQVKALHQFPQATRRSVQHLEKWHQFHGNFAIVPDEMLYLSKTDDLIKIVPSTKTQVRQFLDRSDRLSSLSIWADPEDPKPPQGSEHVLYFSDKRLDRFASILIILIGVTMLLTPLWILQAVQASLYKLVVISVFILVFLVTMSFTMAARPFEGLAATALRCSAHGFPTD